MIVQICLRICEHEDRIGWLTLPINGIIIIIILIVIIIIIIIIIIIFPTLPQY